MHVFKKLTLRNIARRRAPYIRNGSLPMLEAVVVHYESGFIARDMLSADMRSFSLNRPGTPGSGCLPAVVSM